MAKRTRGGKYSRKQMIGIDFSNFSDYAEQLEDLGADLKSIFADAMEDAAATIQKDTMDALANSNLPAQGKYSRGTTEKQVIVDAQVTWSGMLGEIPLGFDKSKQGAGGWLITGTPKMPPDYALEDIYGRKKYENQIKKQIEAFLQKEIDKRIGG